MKNITNKAKKTLQSNNYCKTTVERIVDNQTHVIKEYYKDGKSKLVWKNSNYENLSEKNKFYLKFILTNNIPRYTMYKNT